MQEERGKERGERREAGQIREEAGPGSSAVPRQVMAGSAKGSGSGEGGGEVGVWDAGAPAVAAMVGQSFGVFML